MRIVALLFAMLLVTARPAGAGLERLPIGDPAIRPFVFDVAFTTDAWHPGDPLRVLIHAGNSVGVDALLRYRLTIPRGLRVVSGETSVTNRESTDRPAILELRPEKTGAFEIHGRAIFDVPRGKDIAEFVLGVTVGRDSVTPGIMRTTVFESIHDGQRYRYDDRFKVPIATDEPGLESELEVRARPIEELAARCPRCERSLLPDTVAIPVLVGRDGEAREILDGVSRTSDPEVLHVARKVLDRYRFRAARAHGRAVTDAIVVRIPVLAE